MEGLTHFDEHGNARMVDVGEKAVTDRIATAHGFIHVNREVYEAIKQGTAKKGAGRGARGRNHGGEENF